MKRRIEFLEYVIEGGKIYPSPEIVSWTEEYDA